jgi:hypothetical protein
MFETTNQRSIDPSIHHNTSVTSLSLLCCFSFGAAPPIQVRQISQIDASKNYKSTTEGKNEKRGQCGKPNHKLNIKLHLHVHLNITGQIRTAE